MARAQLGLRASEGLNCGRRTKSHNSLPQNYLPASGQGVQLCPRLLRLKFKNLLAALRDLPEQRALRVALFVWAVYLLVLGIIMAVQPDIGLVMKIYRNASAAWWQGEPVYVASSRQGFFYLPQAAMFFTPILFFPVAVGEILWRSLIVVLFAWSIWQMAGLFGPERRNWRFLVMTIVGLTGSLSAARYGQTNVPLAAFLALAAVSLARAAWKSSALWLLLALVSKPVGVASCLLAGACYPRKVILPLVCGAALLAALSFARTDAHYVAGQYRLFADTMEHARQVPKHSFCDVQGVLRTFGWLPPQNAMTAVRGLAALAALGIALLAVRRYDGVRGAFLCILFSVLYLLLFNPRTESNSYVLLAPFLGVFVADAARRPGDYGRLVWLLIFAATLTCENWGPLHRLTNLWLKASATMVFTGFLVRDVLKGSDPFGLSAPPGSAAGRTSAS